MAQSLTRVYIQMIFSTKHRKSMIDEEIEVDLFRYLGGICRGLDCMPIQVGGYLDHTHILCGLSKKITIMDLLQKVKQSSSSWIKEKDQRFSNFYWQDGYAAFSVSPGELEAVAQYIRNQKQHHQNLSFQDECRIIFKKHGVDLDEKYFWS